MKRLFIALLSCVFVASLWSAPVKKENVKWYSDVASAQKELKGAKKSIVLFFTAPGWCGPCRMLEAGPVASPEFAELIKKSAVAVKMDFSNRNNISNQARAALQQYRIQGFPSMLVLDARGKEKGRIVGNLPSKEFFSELKALLNK